MTELFSIQRLNNPLQEIKFSFSRSIWAFKNSFHYLRMMWPLRNFALRSWWPSYWSYVLFFSRRFTVFTLHSFSSAVLRVPLGQIYILILDISKNFAKMAWNSPKRVSFTSFECNGRKAQITNHVWSGSRENPSPSFAKSDTTNLGNIFHRCCYRNKFA